MLTFNPEPKLKRAVKPIVSLYKYCFVLVFSISFLCENAFAFSTNHFTGNDQYGNVTHSVVYGHHKTAGIPIDFPFVAEPDGIEDSETESDSEAGFELDYCFAGFGHTSVSETAFEKSSTTNFVSLIQKREPVSLIVLHHSWKNHLA